MEGDGTPVALVGKSVVGAGCVAVTVREHVLPIVGRETVRLEDRPGSMWKTTLTQPLFKARVARVPWVTAHE